VDSTNDKQANQGRLAVLARYLTLTLLVALAGIATPVQSLAQTTLNMSHDLVTLGIAGQNLTPNNPALDAGPLIQAAFNYVQSHQVQTLTLDTGAYYLLGNQNVSLFGKSNLTIDFAGSTIYFKGPMMPNGLGLSYCTNVTWKNFQIDYVTPPYTHVQLTSVDTVGLKLSYQTLPGWPDPASFNGVTNPFGGSVEGFWAAIFRNGQIVPGTTRTLLDAPFSNNSLAVSHGFYGADSATLTTLQPGDTIAVTVRGGGPPIIIWESDSILLNNIAIYGSPTWAVQLFQTSNSTVDNVRVMPRPGTGLIGSNADGIHFVAVGPNNHIRNSYVARTMDDALIMDSLHAATVVNQSGLRQLTVRRDGYVRFPNGTPINFVRRDTMLEFAGATIISQSPPDGVVLEFSGLVNLTFDQDLPSMPVGTILAFGSAALRGQGSTIEDNIVEDTFGGRGVWLPGVQGVTVRRNVLRRTSNAAIIVQSSTESVIDPNGAGPPSHDVTITDNSIEGALGPQGPGNGMQGSLAGIQVVTTSDPFFIFSAVAANTNVQITRNYIADSGRSGIWIGELNGGVLNKNLIIRYSQNPTLGGVAGLAVQDRATANADALLPLAIHYSSSVTETENTIAATSPITAPVTMTPQSTAVAATSATGSFTLQTAIDGFAWKAVSDSPWLIISSASAGSGGTLVQFSVSANPAGTPRIGKITIAGQTFLIAQPGKRSRSQVTSQ